MTDSKTKKRPRPGRPAVVFNESELAQIFEYASKGLSQYQIAEMMGVCQDTMVEIKKRDPLTREALEKGKIHGIEAVANALFEKATVERDTTSMIFYLKNRDPERWEDVQKRQYYGDANKDAVQTESKVKHTFDASAVAEKVKDVLSKT